MLRNPPETKPETVGYNAGDGSIDNSTNQIIGLCFAGAPVIHQGNSITQLLAVIKKSKSID